MGTGASRPSVSVCVMFIGLTLLITASASATTYRIAGLVGAWPKSAPYPSAYIPEAVNDWGVVAGSYNHAGDHYQGYMWNPNSGSLDILGPDHEMSAYRAYDVNPGAVLVGAGNIGPYEDLLRRGFLRYMTANDPTYYYLAPLAGDNWSEAHGIEGNAVVGASGTCTGLYAGGLSTMTEVRATAWSQVSNPHDLGTLGGTDSFALAIDAGATPGHYWVAGYADAADEGQHAALWDWSGASHSVTDLGAGTAYDANSSGQAAGESGGRATRWETDHTATDLGEGSARGINDAGDVVGGYGGGAFVCWSGTASMVNLKSLLSPADAEAWDLSYAVAINNNAQIVGYGTYWSGGEAHYGTFIMSRAPVPEPATLGLVAIAAAGLGCLLRRRTR